MAGALPDDLWVAVADFLGAAALSHASRHLCALLQYRHLRVPRGLDGEPQGACGAWLRAHAAAAHTVRVYGDSWTISADAEAVDVIDALSHATGLRALEVLMAQRLCTTPCSQALGRLNALPCLHTLDLCLHASQLTDGDATELTALGRLPALRTLALDVSDNLITAVGAHVLTALRHAPRLEVLTLQLQSNELGDAGAVALTDLVAVPKLRRLVLNVADNGMTAVGLTTLVEALIAAAPWLTRLTVAVSDAEWSSAARPTLRRLDACPSASVQVVEADADLFDRRALTSHWLHHMVAGVGTLTVGTHALWDADVFEAA